MDCWGNDCNSRLASRMLSHRPVAQGLSGQRQRSEVGPSSSAYWMAALVTLPGREPYQMVFVGSCGTSTGSASVHREVSSSTSVNQVIVAETSASGPLGVLWSSISSSTQGVPGSGAWRKLGMILGERSSSRLSRSVRATSRAYQALNAAAMKARIATMSAATAMMGIAAHRVCGESHDMPAPVLLASPRTALFGPQRRRVGPRAVSPVSGCRPARPARPVRAPHCPTWDGRSAGGYIGSSER